MKKKMKNLLIDGRIRKIEYDFLQRYFCIKKIPLSSYVYDEISGHSDIFYCKIKDRIICAPNSPIIENEFMLGATILQKKYPNDIAYNVCQIGENIIGSKYTDSTINPNIIVKQGYTKCSIAVTGENSCITSDRQIYKVLKKNNVDVCFIEEHNIKLLDRNSEYTKMEGFIGGACFIFDNNFVLFGDIESLKSKELLKQHLYKYNLNLRDFKGLSVNDYGGAIIY